MIHIPATVEFAEPVQRGLPPDLCAWERQVTDTLRQARTATPATLYEVSSQPEAETVRRRVYRGKGPWSGGARTWVVVCRKQLDRRGTPPRWRVSVALRAGSEAS